MKALSIGINKYNVAPLRGCITDSNDLTTELIERGFDVSRLLDEQATKSNIIEKMHQLLSESKTKFILHYSGHGSQIPCSNGSEEDGLTEILCPFDLINSDGSWTSNYITDDEIQQLFSEFPDIHIEVILDCCHSGTATRDIKPTSITPRFIQSPVINSSKNIPFGVSNDNVICWSGCTDNQTAADSFIDGKYRGAFTTAFLTASGNREIMFKNITDYMIKNGYEQRPVLTCTDKQRTESMF
jgi:hypothetical protein